MEFLRQILCGDKKYVPTTNLNIVQVPIWEEFSAGKIWEFASKDSRFKDFLPDFVEKRYLKILL